MVRRLRAAGYTVSNDNFWHVEKRRGTGTIGVLDVIGPYVLGYTADGLAADYRVDWWRVARGLPRRKGRRQHA